MRAHYALPMDDGSKFVVARSFIIGVKLAKPGYPATIFVSQVVDPFTIADKHEVTTFLAWLDGTPINRSPPDGRQPENKSRTR